VQGCSICFFGSKVRESSRTLELFEGFDVQFWETGPWAPPPTFKSSQLVVCNYRGEKGAGMGPCHHCRAVKGEPSGAVQVLRCINSLAVEKCVTSLGLKTKEIPGLVPITDHISYKNYWTCYFYCKERVGLNWGELLSHAILTDACCKVWQTLKSPSNFDRTPNGTFKVRCNAWKFANPNFWPNLELNNPTCVVLMHTLGQCRKKWEKSHQVVRCGIWASSPVWKRAKNGQYLTPPEQTCLNSWW